LTNTTIVDLWGSGLKKKKPCWADAETQKTERRIARVLFYSLRPEKHAIL